MDGLEDRAPPTEAGPGGGDEEVGYGVGQRGREARPEEALATGGPQAVLPRRWVVERTFSWLGQNRRLSKDYERLPESGEAFIYAAISRLMARRLARS
jgi:hypothetical protein